jgi:F0F1-type ATP synthase membrane subunit b/b'
MSQSRTPTSDFAHALGTAKKQANGIADEATDAAQDLYDHARESAADLANSTNKAARQTANSFERALRGTIENQPYTAVTIALGLGWLLGRIHRPL